jgi:uncharacterized membrane protein YbhN (UPF0104 family)
MDKRSDMMFGESKIIWKLVLLVLIIALGLIIIYFKSKNDTEKSIDSIKSYDISEKASI